MKDIRTSKGLSMRAFARLIGVNHQKIANYETDCPYLDRYNKVLCKIAGTLEGGWQELGQHLDSGETK